MKAGYRIIRHLKYSEIKFMVSLLLLNTVNVTSKIPIYHLYSGTTKHTASRKPTIISTNSDKVLLPLHCP